MPIVDIQQWNNGMFALNAIKEDGAVGCYSREGEVYCLNCMHKRAHRVAKFWSLYPKDIKKDEKHWFICDDCGENLEEIKSYDPTDDSTTDIDLT